jgi:hypothetical protein
MPMHDIRHCLEALGKARLVEAPESSGVVWLGGVESPLYPIVLHCYRD